MAFNYQRGDFCPVLWQPAGGALATLNIKAHSLDISSLLFDVSNTGSSLLTGGLRARIPGLRDVQGTVSADYDLDSPPYGAISIFDGLSGVCGFNLSPLKTLQVPVIIEKVHYEMAVESEIKYSFDVKANSRAGLIVYPPL